LKIQLNQQEGLIGNLRESTGYLTNFTNGPDLYQELVPKLFSW